MVRVVVGFLVDFRIFGFFGFEDLFRPADQGNHSQHPCDAVGRLGDTSGAHRGQISPHFWPAWWSDF